MAIEASYLADDNFVIRTFMHKLTYGLPLRGIEYARREA